MLFRSTSAASVRPAAAAPTEAVETELPGLRVLVWPAAGTKCVRCWHRREDVGTHAAHSELCGRCVDNVDGAGEVRAHA